MGAYAAAQGVDHVVVVGDAARGIAVGAGERSVLLDDNAAVASWVEQHLRPDDAVLFKASNGARLYEVAAALQ